MDSEKYLKPTTRRDFIRQASCAAVGTVAMTSTIRDLRLINTAIAAQGPVTGYKALVCLFLSGGNDANNWIVPTDTPTYAEYSGIRGNLALPQSSLLTLRQGTSGSSAAYVDADGHNLGFHPTCTELRTLFGEKKLAVVFNTGTLVRPITRAEYLSAASGTKPPQLFSHSDQVTQWQTSIPDQPPTTGWGGRVADIMNSLANPSGNISMSVSLNGANTFQVGNSISQYHVSPAGAVTLTNLSPSTAKTAALQAIVDAASTNLQRTAYAGVVDRAIATGQLLNTSILGTATSTDTPAGTWVWNAAFPTSSLGTQLKMIARLIAAHGPAGFDMNRQIFFCSAGGYDTHTAQVTFTPNLNTTTGSHADLLNDVSECVYAFQKAMEQIGESNNVTTFTASDFARTLPTNSQGSDHGWGSHHIMVGGAVDGGKTFGNLPIFAINGPNDTGLGRWIPTLSVDQHSATLAKWFGVDSSVMADIFPNLSRFPGSYGLPTGPGYIGFMK